MVHALNHAAAHLAPEAQVKMLQVRPERKDGASPWLLQRVVPPWRVTLLLVPAFKETQASPCLPEPVPFPPHLTVLA